MTSLFPAKIIKAAALVGTLDILAASVQFYLKTGKEPAPVFKFIASGVFGEKAFTTGPIMILYGLVIHYVISLVFTVIFFWACDKFPQLLKMKTVTGIAFGIFIWTVMNLLVLPISNAPQTPFDLRDAFMQATILIACIGIPLSLIASYCQAK